MSSMNKALQDRYTSILNEYKSKSKEELITLRKEAIERNENRIDKDWDDNFVSTQVDSTIIDVCNMLLNPVKNNTGKIIYLDGYRIETIGIREYNISKDNIVNVVINCKSCKGKGARKYSNDLDSIYNFLGSKEGKAMLI